MGRFTRIIKPVLRVVFVFVLIFIGIRSCAVAMCGNEVFEEQLSPDGKLKAVIFQRDCGATTGFSTQISVLNSHKKLKNESGNVFVISGHPDSVAPEVAWNQNSDTLFIHYALNGDEPKAETTYGVYRPVSIQYVSDDR